MQTLQYSFFILQYCGVWRPTNWPENSLKTQLYRSYTIVLSFLIITVTLFEFVYLISTIKDITKLANNSFILLSMIGMCVKATNILKKRDRVIELTLILKNDICRPSNNEEITIQRQFDDQIRSNMLWYAALAAVMVVTMYIASILQDIPAKEFPFDTWLPWDRNTVTGYWICYMHQIIAHGAGAAINIACDTLVADLMIQACAQFCILKKRFSIMPKLIESTIVSRRNGVTGEPEIVILERKILAQYVRNHLIIIDLAKKINFLFEEIIFVQFFISTFVLCFSVYQLSTLPLFSADFTSTILYLSCMSFQVFFICYYGSEITIESMNIGNAIYAMKWETMSTKMQISLLTIMVRTQRPIKYTSGRVITVSLDSFNSLIKLSYSAYNLLQQSSQ